MPMKRHDDIQSSGRLAVTQQPVYSPPPPPASRPANRAAAECAAPVLTAAPSIGVAHTRHASLSGTADHVGRSLHQSTEPALPATPARAPSYSSPSVTAFPCGVTIAAPPAAAPVLVRGLSPFIVGVRPWIPDTARGAIRHRRSWDLPAPAQGAVTPRNIGVPGVAFLASGGA